MAQAITWSDGKPYEYVDGALSELKQSDLYTMPDGSKYSYNGDGSLNTNPSTGYAAQGSAQGIPQWLINANQGQNISNDAVSLGGNIGYRVGDQIYSGNQWQGEPGGSPTGKSLGDTFYNYKNTPLLQYAGQTGRLSQLNGSSYNTLNGSGNITGSGIWNNIKDSHSATTDAIVTAIVGAAFGGIGAYGAGAGAAAGASEGAVGSGAGFVGEGAASGVGAWDSALAGATAGDVGTAAGAAGGAYNGAAADSQLANSQLGITGDMAAADANAAAVPSVTVNGATSGGNSLAGSSLADAFTPSNTVKAVSAGSQLFNSNGKGDSSTNDLVNAITPFIPGAIDAYTQGNTSDKMLQWLNGQQSKIDGMYAPGSDEYNYLWNAMSRKDAAAGRNSQYGPRSVDLASRITDTKANYTSRLAQALAGNFQTAYNQDASKYSGLLGALGNTGGNTGSLLNSFLRLFNGGSFGTGSLAGTTVGQYGVPDNSYDIADWWSGV